MDESGIIVHAGTIWLGVRGGKPKSGSRGRSSDAVAFLLLFHAPANMGCARLSQDHGNIWMALPAQNRKVGVLPAGQRRKTWPLPGFSTIFATFSLPSRFPPD
ncbi:hypothetical protein [Primorskyibacter marinus]|uniref:hypothetical protein n=1 Tax=Primorskyibacter marinus TaxID=1977320 RepID=UPI0013009C4D|nr:hypothetical protein [Primorskyibacter marinus]